MIIRKRAHHLTKILIHPDRYSQSLKQRLRGELADLLVANQGWKQRSWFQWAEDILTVYDGSTGQQGQHQESEIPSIGRPTTDPEKAVRQHSLVDIENLLELMRQRRSSRNFEKGGIISSQELHALVEAALHAPSACNRQPMYFLSVTDLALKTRLAQTCPGGSEFFADAACLLLVLVDASDYRYPENRYQPWLDTAAAIQNLLLAAQSMRLAVCWGDYPPAHAKNLKKKLRQDLGIDDKYLATACLAIGRVAAKPGPVPRVMPAERLFLNRMV